PGAETGTVRAVADSRTLLLDDGRTIHLAGLDGSAAPDAAEAAAGWLRTHVAGRAVVFPAARPDRYGRIPAFAFLNASDFLNVSDLEGSIQHDMVGLGLARVMPQGLAPLCAAALLTHEDAARTAGRGLWADPANAVRRADDPAAVRAARGRMAVVEGRVLSVRESGGTIYVNFGRRWSEDFTVTIARRAERRFTAGGMAPKELAHRTVRVRGIVEERGGPWIEVTEPEQIEIVEPRETRMVR
ncbi:MAG: thermonuclease family protein, partial [Rhizobiales bacterium]|nr:thermonuclease family protein [Hyphomicrobiales bacterium]